MFDIAHVSNLKTHSTVKRKFVSTKMKLPDEAYPRGFHHDEI